MFLRAELPVLCLDIYENGKLYSSFFSPCFSFKNASAFLLQGARHAIA